MVEFKRKRLAGVLFLCAGGVFVIAGFIKNQAPTFGLAAINFCAGVAFLMQARRDRGKVGRNEPL
jgi:uncharacterized membrane protein HdeD (DUF308 family)